MAREVKQVLVQYMDTDGNWQSALRGEEIDVHKDDLARVEASGAFGESAEADASEEPPRAGKGSGVEAWVAYAEAQGLEVPEGASRDDVVALVDDANK